MKHIRKIAALALAAGLSLTALWPSMTADATAIDIDESAFSEVKQTERTVYIWQEGLPTYTNQNERTPFQILLTWDDTYFWRITRDFARCCKNNLGDFTSMIKHGWSNNNNDIYTMNGSFDAKGDYPHGAYDRNLGYTGSRLSDISGKLNFEALKSSGSYLTLDLLEGVPQVWPLTSGDPTSFSSSRWDAAPSYSITVDLPSGGGWLGYSEYAERYTDGGFRTGRNHIFGARYDQFDHWTTTEHFIGVIPYTVHHQSTAFNWTIHGGTTRIMEHLNFIYGNLLNNFALGAKYSIRPKASMIYTKELGWYVWKTTKNGRNYYTFHTLGQSLHDMDGYWCDEMDDAQKLYHFLYSVYPSIALSHRNGDFGTKGDLPPDSQYKLFTGQMSKRGDTTGDEISFNCYYALPTTMNIINTSFTVENGQVSNFDVATALQNGAVCTVKNGGTLSVEGLLLNNGTIKIEEGGTLYIQDGGCVCRYKDGSTRGGNIDCKGLIIIGENSKLIGGGSGGIKLDNGAHVVNYGLLASENFEVVNDHTVENRSGGFTLIGKDNGVIGSGFGAYSTPLDYAKKTFSERGASVPDPIAVEYNGHESDWQYEG